MIIAAEAVLNDKLRVQYISLRTALLLECSFRQYERFKVLMGTNFVLGVIALTIVTGFKAR